MSLTHPHLKVWFNSGENWYKTSTCDHDRGKGLSEMLEFIDKIENGYISIISDNDLFRYDDRGGK